MLRIAAQRPKNNENPSALFNHFGAILIGFDDTQFVETSCVLVYRPKKLIGGLSCMHRGQKYIQVIWNHQNKIPLVETYKECAICAILRENNPFCLPATAAKTCCAMVCRGPKIMQIPRSYQKKYLLRRKSAILSIRWKFHCIKNNHFGAILIRFRDT